jgi:hypothetical protein
VQSRGCWSCCSCWQTARCVGWGQLEVADNGRAGFQSVLWQRLLTCQQRHLCVL